MPLYFYRVIGGIPASAPLYCYVFFTERLAESLPVPHYIAMYSLQSGWPNPCECLIILLCILYRAVGRIPAGAPPGPLHHGPGVPVCAGADPEDVLSPADFPLAHRHHRNGTDLSLSLCWSLSVHCVFLSFTCMSVCSSVSPFFCLSFVCLSVLFLSVCYKHKCHI